MNPTTIILIVLMVAVFYFLMIRPQQKKQKEQQSMQKALGPGSTVMLISRVYGEIVDNSDPNTAVVRIAPGVEVTVGKQAIMTAVPASDVPFASGVDTDDTDDEDTLEPDGSADELGSGNFPAYGEDLSGNDVSSGSSGYEAPGSATRSADSADSTPGSTEESASPNKLGSTSAADDRASGSSRITDGDSAVDPTDDENPNNPKA